jgi:hypothetical protein
MQLSCPYLGATVELTEERAGHIAENHPDLVLHWDLVAETLRDPHEIRASRRFGNARMFSRWYDEAKGGKHVVVVVVSEVSGRHWVVTAYIARRLAGGTAEWTRN